MSSADVISQRKSRAKKMARLLELLYPEEKHEFTELNYTNPWELTVAVMLSARTTDKKVNEVTGHLFKKYKKISHYADCNPNVLAKDIFSLGFFNAKSRNIVGAARIVQDKFGGRVPGTIEEMIQLPGVARKTANVVLWNAYGIITGIPVDTHVRRFAIRFGLTNNFDPIKIEQDLMQIVPKKKWPGFSHRLILYGRQVCPGRRHYCKNHPLTRIYPKSANIWPKSL